MTNPNPDTVDDFPMPEPTSDLEQDRVEASRAKVVAVCWALGTVLVCLMVAGILVRWGDQAHELERLRIQGGFTYIPHGTWVRLTPER